MEGSTGNGSTLSVATSVIFTSVSGYIKTRLKEFTKHPENVRVEILRAVVMKMGKNAL
jgi:hypothetical protein